MKCSSCNAETSEDSRFCNRCGTPIHNSGDVQFNQTRTILKPRQELPSGITLAKKFKIIEVLGRGGMGIVYKAEDTKLKRSVALKFLPPEMTQNEEARERFVYEAQAAAALSHPHICTIHEIDEEEGKTFIAMEYVEGRSLKELLDQGSLDINEALDIAIQVAEGMEEAHGKDIVHRDIKSANIMISDKGQAKIMDFGLAKVRGRTLLTREGTTLGTVGYMSPEQAQGEEVDQRSDIWSFGVVVYEMLSGQLPFKGDLESAILYSVVHEEPRPLKEINSAVPPELSRIIDRALKKKRESRYSSVTEMLKDLKGYRDGLLAEELGGYNLRTLLRQIRKPRVALSAVCVVALLTTAAVWFFNRQAKIRWAKLEAVPEIERLVETSWIDFTKPYKIAVKAEKYIPKDQKLAELMAKCSLKISIGTEPPGAEIFVKQYGDPESEWEYLGISPIEGIRLPVGIIRVKMEKEGYETVLAASSTWNLSFGDAVLLSPIDLSRTLDKKGSIPAGMVRVQGEETPLGRLDDFFIDRYEVTNRQFKEFVESGGYRTRDYWKQEIVRDGKTLAWEDAIAEFVDQTGRPGPAMWQAGDYPAEEDDHPVSGISWYEAAAYAEFVGKSLPTGQHWGLARGEYTPMIIFPQLGGYALFAPFSNFNGRGPVPSGSQPGITSYGAYDMAGNVREWCWNDTPMGKLIRGGAWNDNTYMFDTLSQVPPLDRSLKNGFRCALYLDPEKIPETMFQKTDFGETRDFYAEKPVSDSIFEIYKEQYSYDKTALNEQVESRDDSAEDWIHERITFDAAYGGERIIAHLFLPKNAAPPFQTVVYFPGSGSRLQISSEDIESYFEFKSFLSFIVRNGRAVLYPVYKGTFERSNDETRKIQSFVNSHVYSEYLVQLVKDFRRCIDYLETRQDIDAGKLAYYGMSWGAAFGTIIPAVEDRIQASVLVAGGLVGRTRPEADQLNYVTRVKIPTLMLNGKYDTIFIYETCIKPMFDLLGPPDEHKEIKLYDTDHIPAMNDFIRETLVWLDRYLGPVK